MFKNMTSRGNTLMYVLYIVILFLFCTLTINAYIKQSIIRLEYNKKEKEINKDKIKITKFIVFDEDIIKQNTKIATNKFKTYYTYNKYDTKALNDNRYYFLKDVNDNNVLLKYSDTKVYCYTIDRKYIDYIKRKNGK